MRVVPNCVCGGGPMRIFTAYTKDNYGRRFFRCPRGHNHRGSFMWFDECGPEERIRVPVQRNVGHWLLCAGCGCVGGCCLIIFIFVLMFAVMISLK